ncbi:4-alpha-glucanotransferase [Succinivibrio dextrinosolvens DSM 3072]|uniref:4-alpha-glucanotransferase n=1 Tax=Succinivibrio dextrinosolvens DSM 3072 TaxID=1123324 RepID=A0A1T4VPV2_9GAMM|nr:4-alpha-glucanotransferase [Succinivibrio dextrinosolvens]SKA67022.1 4-alpha-glucanotransferase [Succinivibrio dextrinosolvens DSM 3072]
MIDIQLLADKKGIARTYLDATNKLVYISEESRKSLLEILGYPVNDERALQKLLDKEELDEYTSVLDPVTVLTDEDEHQFYIRTPESFGEDETAQLTVTLKLEDGRKIERNIPLEQVEIADYKNIQGTVYDIRRYKLMSDLPYGYHECNAFIKSKKKTLKSISMSLIVCPSKVYTPKEILEGRKVWGVSSQLYTVRSKNNWGIGDFEDLKQLLLGVYKCGGQFVGLNPMHAGYPAVPDESAVSPYSPSSRSFINVIYISVPSVPELLNCKPAQDLIHSEKFQQRLHVLRDKEYVDYRGVIEAKLEVLRVIFDNVKVDDKRSSRGNKFLRFMEQGGEQLINMATYDALQAHYYESGVNAYSWEVFEKEYQNVNSPFVEQWRKDHYKDVLFYCYLQFLAAEQLDDAYRTAKNAGMMIGTYRDLAVGVAKQSCDVWSDVDNVFSPSGSIGAPPDPLGPLGQSWGLSPMTPNALKKAAYRPMIRMYQANMKSCGAIRIDHAAGLFRLWITKLGSPACEGAYVHYSMHDLLGIIALESHRNKCLVIAEDLGTIPVELTKALKKVGAFSYKIFFDERAEDGGYIAPQDYQSQAMSALTTHDMPTLVGWWNCFDLSLGKELGIYTEEEAINLAELRENAKQRILDSMHGLGSVSDDISRDAKEVKMTPDFAKALQIHMCKGSCSLFSTQIEDWIGVDKPVNIPGTNTEYPNWRRKLTADLEFIFDMEHVKTMTKEMTDARNK